MFVCVYDVLSACVMKPWLTGLGYNVLAGAALAAGGTSGSSSSASAAAQRNKRARWMAEEASKFDPFAGQGSEVSKKTPASAKQPLVEGQLVASSEEPPATAAAPSGSKKDKKSKSK